MSPLEHVIYKLRNAQVARYPYAHFYIQDIFPRDFYDALLLKLPQDDDYSTLGHKYNGRRFAPPSASSVAGFLQDDRITDTIAKLFKPEIMERFHGGKNIEVETDLRLILDGENYAIGPHTDASWKIVSLLFYLPPDNGLRDLGTSIYLPNDPSFRCPGGPHHPFDSFTEIYRAPFLPNSCLGFFKTDTSFHGVEPIMRKCRRDVLLWNLYEKRT